METINRTFLYAAGALLAGDNTTGLHSPVETDAATR
jgi:hypothetical protein